MAAVHSNSIVRCEQPEMCGGLGKGLAATSVCIIGGGVAGVVTARVLLGEGVQVTLFEKTNTLGGVWSNNYTGFGIQVPSNLYEFPDEPLPQGCDFASGEVIHTYVKQYAEKHGVYKVAKLNCAVTGMWKHKAGWTVQVLDESGASESRDFDVVVLATGVYSSTDKFIPEFDGAETFEGQYLHSVDFKNVSACEGKNVISIGYGKSAFDCAQISSTVAEKSTLLFRDTHWPVPRKILGLVPFEFATFSRFGAGCLKPAYPKCGRIEKFVHSLPGVLDGFWWLVGKIFAWQFELSSMETDLTPKQGFIADFWGGHGCIPHPDFFRLVKQGSIKAKQGNIRTVKPKSVVLESGEELPADVILFGTGFRPNLSFLPSDLQAKKEEDGLWLYRQMVHPDFPSMVFVNSNTTTFTNITTASIQARWLAEMIASGLPAREEMEADIAEKKAWKRKTMPNAGHARAYMMQTHQVHYYDELLHDMGASVHRKRGFFKVLKEFFEPYRPADYDTIVTGEYKHVSIEAVAPGKRQASFCWELLVLFVCVIVSVTFMNRLMSPASAIMQ